MRKILAALIALAIMAPSAYAQTPEAAHVQEALGGDGISLIEVADVNAVEVVAYSDPNDAGIIAFVIHNGSDETVSVDQVKIDVRDGDTLAGVATANAATIAPTVLSAGDSSIGIIHAHEIVMPETPEITFTVESSEPGRMNALNPDLTPVNLNIVGENLVGEIENPTVTDVTFVMVVFACVDDGGNITQFKNDSQQISLAPNGSAAFQVSNVGACGHYIVGAHAI